jgi:SAM-dependent methyltransferase
MNFDRLAKAYGLLERITAGTKLQRCRMAFLGALPEPRQVLLAGEGHGRFLRECVRRFPNARIVVVDGSGTMLDVARHRLARAKAPTGRVEFVHADVARWEGADGGFDLIVTQFFLDCFPAAALAAVVARLGTLAAPDAHWLVADFQIAPSGLARWRSRVIVGLLYRFFRVVCGLEADALVVPDEALVAAGFSCHARRTSEWGLLKSEWWQRGQPSHPIAMSCRVDGVKCPSASAWVPT